jgi:hypothetical protein
MSRQGKASQRLGKKRGVSEEGRGEYRVGVG